MMKDLLLWALFGSALYIFFTALIVTGLSIGTIHGEWHYRWPRWRRPAPMYSPRHAF